MCFQTPLMMKFNRVICSADVNFCLRETDNLHNDDDDNNNGLDDVRKTIYLNRRKLNFKGKRREFDSPTPIDFYLRYYLNWNWAQHPYLSLGLRIQLNSSAIFSIILEYCWLKLQQSVSLWFNLVFMLIYCFRKNIIYYLIIKLN